MPRSGGSRRGRGAGRRAWASRPPGAARCRRTALGQLDAVAGEDRRARRPTVVGSGTVGPLAITAGSSPGTSEISSETVRAGNAAAASRPPLIRDRCLRTQFISSIEAPERSSALLIACLSASERPSGGRVSSAEPPPEIRAMTRSSSPRPADQLEDPARPPRARPRRAPDAPPRPPRSARRARHGRSG